MTRARAIRPDPRHSLSLTAIDDRFRQATIAAAHHLGLTVEPDPDHAGGLIVHVPDAMAAYHLALRTHRELMITGGWPIVVIPKEDPPDADHEREPARRDDLSHARRPAARGVRADRGRRDRLR
jgi:hypothetical protein